MGLEAQVCKNCQYFIGEGDRCDGVRIICFSEGTSCKQFKLKEDRHENIRNGGTEGHRRQG